METPRWFIILAILSVVGTVLIYGFAALVVIKVLAHFGIVLF